MEHLIRPLDTLTDEELLVRLQETRHNRSVVRPAAAKIVAKAEKKTAAKRTTAVSKLLEGMSEEEKAAFIKSLEEGS